MNEIWKGIVQTVRLDVPGSVHPVLAQVPSQPVAPEQPGVVENGTAYVQNIVGNLSSFVPNLIAAIAILVVGIIIALIASSITKGLLNRTRLDNKIANWIRGQEQGVEEAPVEQWISSAVFWIVIIFTVVAVLQTLQLQVVSQPLNNFLNQIFLFLPNLLGALIFLGVAWVLATLVKVITTRALRVFRLDQRLGQQVRTPDSSGETPPPPTNQFSLSETIGNALYWFIFLLFLPFILDKLGLQGTTLQPLQQMLNQILGILPNILGAIAIAAVGWFIAQVVRRIVTNLLAAAGADQLGSRFGLQATAGSQSLSWLLGTVVYVLILIPTAIAALQTLQIEAISVPAIAMLNQILNAIPKIFTAALILVIAYVIGQFLSDLVTNILTSIGFNNVFQWLGIPTTGVTRTRTVAPPEDDYGLPNPPPTMGSQTVLQPSTVPTRTPSELVGIIVLVGILLFAAVAATNVLKFEALTLIVTGILVIAGRILAGLVVFAIGLWLANLAFNLITSSGSRQSRILGQTARIAIIALVSAMALQQMGIASDIVNLAFGLLLGAIAVAIALAFGLGSRDIAAAQVREWLSSFKENRPPDME